MWVFTLNNYTLQDLTDLPKALDCVGCEFVFQQEEGASGTPHLQGCIKFKNQREFNQVKNLIGPRAHLEKAKGKWPQCVAYSTKQETRSGEIFSNFNWEAVLPKQEEEDEPVLDPLEGKELYDWQKNIIDLVESDPHDRKVAWLWEPTGNTGKTTLAKHLCLKSDRTIYVGGKAEDVKYAISQMKRKPKVVLWDIPRSAEGYVSYSGIEQTKNGIFFSSKYESSMQVFNPPHVVCFANFAPDRDQLSADRWSVWRIRGGDLERDD